MTVKKLNGDIAIYRNGDSIDVFFEMGELGRVVLIKGSVLGPGDAIKIFNLDMEFQVEDGAEV